MRYLSSPKPLLCRELVGRQHELWALGEALEQAARGQPQFVLLAGEAGVGKTKLCRVFMQASQAQQALVLFGQAISQDQALPFAPFLDAFRRYFSTASGRLALARSSLLQANFAFLLDLLPELALLFAAVGSPTFEAYDTGWAFLVRSQPRIVRVSFSTTSSLMWPPALPRTSTMSAGRDTSRRRSRLNWAQPEPPMSGMCR